MHPASDRKVGLCHRETSLDVDATRKPYAHEQTEFLDENLEMALLDHLLSPTLLLLSSSYAEDIQDNYALVL